MVIHSAMLVAVVAAADDMSGCYAWMQIVVGYI